MNKKLILFLLSLTIFIIFLFFKINIIYISILDSLKLFLYKVFPYLITMMIINYFLINLNIYNLFKNKSLYLFILSILSGSPINAIIIKDFLDKKEIKEKDASYLLSFTNFNNPLFIYNYLNIIFNNIFITIKLMIIIYLTNIILFIYFNKKITYHNHITSNNINIINSFITSINKVSLNIINILITIIFFKLIIDLLLPNSLLGGLIEVTYGLNILSILKYSTIIKEIIFIIIISFSGLSIHIQIANILSNYHINYKYFYLSKLFNIILGIILILLF